MSAVALVSGVGAGNEASMQTVASGWDYVVSPNLLSATRVSIQHTSTERIQGDGAPTWTSLGLKTFQYTTRRRQDFFAGGTAGWGGNGFTGRFYVLTPSVSQDFDWNKGEHSVSFGGIWARAHTDGDDRSPQHR